MIRSIMIFMGWIILGTSAVFGYDWSTNPGDGSPENPYQISEPNQLNEIGLHPAIWDKHFITYESIDNVCCFSRVCSITSLGTQSQSLQEP